MRKTFELEDLDCANCAAKMENGIKKLDGVKDASVSFMMQKMTIETLDEVDMDALMKKVVKLCRKVEPDYLKAVSARCRYDFKTEKNAVAHNHIGSVVLGSSHIAARA